LGIFLVPRQAVVVFALRPLEALLKVPVCEVEPAPGTVIREFTDVFEAPVVLVTNAFVGPGGVGPGGVGPGGVGSGGVGPAQLQPCLAPYH
jgi:hypothetical protein